MDVLLHVVMQHAFLAFLTHNPLCLGRSITYVTACCTNVNKAEGAQTYDTSLTDDSSFDRMTDTRRIYSRSKRVEVQDALSVVLAVPLHLERTQKSAMYNHPSRNSKLETWTRSVQPEFANINTHDVTAVQRCTNITYFTSSSLFTHICSLYFVKHAVHPDLQLSFHFYLVHLFVDFLLKHLFAASVRVTPSRSTGDAFRLVVRNTHQIPTCIGTHRESQLHAYSIQRPLQHVLKVKIKNVIQNTPDVVH